MFLVQHHSESVEQAFDLSPGHSPHSPHHTASGLCSHDPEEDFHPAMALTPLHQSLHRLQARLGSLPSAPVDPARAPRRNLNDLPMVTSSGMALPRELCAENKDNYLRVESSPSLVRRDSDSKFSWEHTSTRLLRSCCHRCTSAYAPGSLAL